MMKRLKDALHGFSLPELMVSMALLAILFSICILLYLSSWNRFQITSMMQEAQSNALTGLDRFSRDFGETDASSVKLFAAPGQSHVIFRSARDKFGIYRTTPTGPDWQSYLLYFLSKDKTDPMGTRRFLVRKSYASDPSAVDPSTIDIFHDDCTIISRNVYLFSVENTMNAPPGCFTLRLETCAYYKGQPCKFKIEKQYVLKDLPD
jgi:prepilin-type N-terminal cleavage/methylation domain-containing protein